MILLINQKHFQIESIESIIKPVAIIFCPILIIGNIIRFWEYENLNGTLIGSLKINLDSILIDDNEYPFSNMENFKISVSNYKGQRTHNSKSGPFYYQGVRNSINFTHKSEEIKLSFLLKSEIHLKDLYKILVILISSETISYNRNILNLIPENYRDNNFKNFILKLIVEKRHECTEGLLIHGYSSDEEAKQLRAKYCS